MSNKVSVQGDPLWAKSAENLAGLFNPEAEAKGATMLSTARYNNARAAGQESRNKALTYDALKAAGYTEMEIAAALATQDDSMSSFSKGINEFRGRAALDAGDYRKALVLTGQGNAIDNLAKADISMAGVTDPATGKIDPSVASAFMFKPENVGGDTMLWDPVQKKYVADRVNPQGQNYLAGAEGKTAVAGANVKKIDAQTTAISNWSDAKIEQYARLTDAQIEELVNKGANRDALTAARKLSIEHMSGLATEKNDALIEGIKAKTAGFNDESAARIRRTNSLIDLDGIKGQVALLGDPVKKAQAQATLYAAIENHYAKDFSENLGTNKWEQVDPAQKKALSDRALEYMRRGDDFGLALAKSEKDHGLTGKMVKGQKSQFFGLRTSPDGKISFDGFTTPSALADAVAAGSGAAAPAKTPVIKVPEKKEEPKVAAPATTPAPAVKKTESVPAGDIDLSTKTYAHDLGIKPEDLLKYSKAAGITVKEYHDKIKANPAALEAIKKANKPASTQAAPAAKTPVKIPAPAAKPVPSQISIDALKADPSLASKFDERYGAGAAAAVLKPR